jgi:hypothetical protein
MESQANLKRWADRLWAVGAVRWRHARDTLKLTADYLLRPDGAATFTKELPTPHWFATQREAVGSESFVYSCLEIAACDKILQWGFDETSLDGHPTFNQWCLLERANGVAIITLECAGLLPSSMAAETVEHIKKTWKRGRACVKLVRDELGIELQDIRTVERWRRHAAQDIRFNARHVLYGEPSC